MIGTIEQSIIDALKSADLGYPLFVSSFKATDDDDLAIVLKNKPYAALVVCTGERATFKKGGDYYTPVGFTILLVSKNVRNERAARTGDDNGAVGIYQIIDDVKNLLHGNDFGFLVSMAHQGSTPVNTSPVKGFYKSVWAVDFEATYRTTIGESTQIPSDFITLNTTWELPESANTQTTLTYERESNGND